MISLMIGTLLLATAPAPTEAVATPPSAVAPKEERKICKRETVSTSLHGSKRVCLTATEWRKREQRATDEDMGAVSTK